MASMEQVLENYGRVKYYLRRNAKYKAGEPLFDAAIDYLNPLLNIDTDEINSHPKLALRAISNKVDRYLRENY